MLPELHFTLLETLVGIEPVTLFYRGRRGMVTEAFTFNDVARVKSSMVCYALES